MGMAYIGILVACHVAAEHLGVLGRQRHAADVDSGPDSGRADGAGEFGDGGGDSRHCSGSVGVGCWMLMLDVVLAPLV